MKKMINKIDYILDQGECWTINYFPKRIISLKRYSEVENFLLTNDEKKEYIKKNIRILLKLYPYDKSHIWICEANKKYLKKYAGSFLPQKMKIEKKIEIIKKAILVDSGVSILFESLEIVICMSLYNSSIYFINKNPEYVNLMKKIVESEGLFLWRSN